MTNSVLTYSERMTEDMRSAIELAVLPAGPQEVERELIEATTADVADIAGVARLISMAHTAISVADAGIDGIAAPWYREIAKRLMHRAAEGLTMVEAIEQRRATGLN